MENATTGPTKDAVVLDKDEEKLDKLLRDFACSILVLLGLVGVSLLEAGSVRSKNTASILTRHLVSLLATILIFWILGYAMAFGDGHFFVGGEYFGLYKAALPQHGHWVLQATIAAMPAAIVGAAVAERTHMTGMIVFTAVAMPAVMPPPEIGTRTMSR